MGPQKTVLTPFSIDQRDGGGWATRKLLHQLGGYNIRERKSGLVYKLLWQVLGLMVFPFLHPIFTRYPSLYAAIKSGELVLNFSQTFSCVLVNKNATLVCHDLQAHREFFFKSWVCWSEKFLLKSASQIVTLSSRDKRFLVEQYNICSNKIRNINDVLLSGVTSYRKSIPRRPKCVFLGGLDRRENRQALAWVRDEIVPHFDDLTVDVIGGAGKFGEAFSAQFVFLGQVESVNATLSQYDILLAPMFSAAGIKIKVIEALSSKLAVLGTHNAFSGMDIEIASGYVSDDPNVWLQTLRTPPEFEVSMR